MKKTHTLLVMVPVKVEVEFNEEEGFYYATVPVPGPGHFSRPTAMTVRSADKDTAMNEAIRMAGFGATEKST